MTKFDFVCRLSIFDSIVDFRFDSRSLIVRSSIVDLGFDFCGSCVSIVVDRRQPDY